MKSRENKWLEVLGVITILSILLVLQIIRINMYNGFSSENPLLINAIVIGEPINLPQLNGGEYFYSKILSIVCAFLGNNSNILYYTQGIFQWIISIFLFMFLKKQHNVISAMIATMLFGIFAIEIELSSEVFIMLMISFLIALSSWVIKFEKNITHYQKIVAISILGYLWGLSISIDFVMIIFIGLLVFSFIMNRKVEIKIIISYLVGVLLGIFTIILCKMLLSGLPPMMVITEYVQLYFGEVNVVGLKNSSFLEYINNVYIIGASFIFLVGILGGLIYSNKRSLIIGVTGIILLLVLIIFDIGIIHYERMIMLVVSFIFSNSIYGICGKYMKRKSPHHKTEIQELDLIKDNHFNKKEETIDTLVKTQGENKHLKIEIPQVQFIPNPLPLPKKHVPKKLNYGFEPENEQMKFDIELNSKNNYYDI